MAVRHRAAYAEVLLTAPREPETLAALGQWCQEIPDLTRRLAPTILDGQRVPAQVAVAAVIAHAERAADWGPHLALVRSLKERPRRTSPTPEPRRTCRTCAAWRSWSRGSSPAGRRR